MEKKRIIKHKFIDQYPIVGKKILIIGTFNPATECNPAKFYYGRNKNYFWELLPKVFGEDSLKDKSIDDKINFLKNQNIELTDLIYRVEINIDDIGNYSDDKLQNVKEWNTENIMNILEKNITKEVYFTRISFNDVKQIKEEVQKIENFCKVLGIKFEYLPTPSRPPNYNENMKKWISKFAKK